MIEALLALPPHVRKRLAQSLASGALTAPFSNLAVRSTLGLDSPAGDIAVALEELATQGVEGLAAAALLEAVDKVENAQSRVDLVWSGPEVRGLHARDTRRVYEELLGSAERTVIASTFAYFDGPTAFKTLAERMDSIDGLAVTLLLNVHRRKGDAGPADSLVRRFADRFWSKDWPGKAKPNVYFDPRSLEMEGPAGVLHAKALVVDSEAVFVTSANLTEAALDRNIEVGLLARDHALAMSLSSHFQGLIDRGLLAPLPSE